MTFTIITKVCSHCTLGVNNTYYTITRWHSERKMRKNVLWIMHYLKIIIETGMFGLYLITVRRCLYKRMNENAILYIREVAHLKISYLHTLEINKSRFYVDGENNPLFWPYVQIWTEGSFLIHDSVREYVAKQVWRAPVAKIEIVISLF